ncbi:MAG: hypothetical protein ACO3MZ_05630 [Flavobacteriaceae bacterium]
MLESDQADTPSGFVFKSIWTGGSAGVRGWGSFATTVVTGFGVVYSVVGVFSRGVGAGVAAV